MRIPPKTAAVATAVLALALGVLAITPASAATRARGFQLCPVSAFGYSGQMICGTTILPADKGTNTLQEEFVIGGDWSIWHAWSGSNGWKSLGGQAQRTVTNGVWQWSANPFAIYTFGTDGNKWCDNWGVPAWGGWHLC